LPSSVGIFGFNFKLLGGNQTFTYKNTTANWDAAIAADAGQRRSPFAFSIAREGIGGLTGASPLLPPSVPQPLDGFATQASYFGPRYAVNTRGPAVQLTIPARVGALPVTLHLQGASLDETRPAFGVTQIFAAPRMMFESAKGSGGGEKVGVEGGKVEGAEAAHGEPGHGAAAASRS